MAQECSTPHGFWQDPPDPLGGASLRISPLEPVDVALILDVVHDVPRREGLVLSRYTLRKRFRTACRVLGVERLKSLTIHHGRHTFISHALAGGRTLAEVRDAAGHSNVSITSGYLHVTVDESDVGTLFS